MNTTIVLADDHAIFREGLRSLIEKNRAGRVVGEAGTGVEAVECVQRLRPDLVIMDLTMPVMNGIDATRTIVQTRPDTRVLALSMESDRFFVVEALKAGAGGYLLKDTVYAELADAIDVVARGDIYLPQKVASLLVKEFVQRIPEEAGVVYQHLTTREREILQLIADGKTVKEIAHLFGSSLKTVDNQRHALMQKLQLFSIAGLTKFAVRHGLTAPE